MIKASYSGATICCNKNDLKSSFDWEIVLVHTNTRRLCRGCDWSNRLWSTVRSLLGSLVSMVLCLLASRVCSWCLASLYWHPPKRTAHCLNSFCFSPYQPVKQLLAARGFGGFTFLCRFLNFLFYFYLTMHAFRNY